MELRVNNFTNTSTLVIWRMPLTCSMISYTNTFYKIYYQSFKPLLFTTNLLFVTINHFFKTKTLLNYAWSFLNTTNSLILPKKFKRNTSKVFPKPLTFHYKSLQSKKLNNKVNYTIHPNFFTNSLGYYKKSFQALLGEVYFNRNIMLFEELDQKLLFKTSHLKLPSVFKKLKTRIRRLKYTPVTGSVVKSLLVECARCSDNKQKFFKLTSKLIRIVKKRKLFKKLLSRVYNLLNTFNNSQVSNVKPPRLKLILDKNIIMNVKKGSEYKPYTFIKNKRFLVKPKITSKNNFAFQVYKYARKTNKIRKVNTKLSYRSKRYVYLNNTNYTTTQVSSTIKTSPQFKKRHIKSINYVVPFYSTLMTYLSKTTLISIKHSTYDYLNLNKHYKKPIYFSNYKKKIKQVCMNYNIHTYLNKKYYKYGCVFLYRSRKRRYVRKWFYTSKQFKKLNKFKPLQHSYRLPRLIRHKMYIRSGNINYKRVDFLPKNFKLNHLSQVNLVKGLQSKISKGQLESSNTKLRSLIIEKRKLLPLILSYYLEYNYSSSFSVIKYLNKIRYSRFTRFKKNGTTLMDTYRRSFLFKMIKFNLKSVNRFIRRKGSKNVKKVKFTLTGSSVINVLGHKIYKNINEQSFNKSKIKVSTKKLTRSIKVKPSFRTLFLIYKLKLSKLSNLKLKRNQKSLKYAKRQPLHLLQKNLHKSSKTQQKWFSKKSLNTFKNDINPELKVLKKNINFCKKSVVVYLRSFRKMHNNFMSNKLWFKYYTLLPFSLIKLSDKSNKVSINEPRFISTKTYLSWKLKNTTYSILNFSKNNLRKSQKFDIIRTVHKLPFILPSYGFLYITNLILPDLLKKRIAFSHTRVDYSFTSVRDLKKQKLSCFTKAKSVFKLFFMNKLSTNGVALSFWNNKLSNEINIGSMIHASGHNFRFLNKYWNGVYDIKKEPFIDNVTNKKVISIKRIKFKPGYSKMWRAARTSYKQINNLNFRYQHRLTKHLVELYRTRIWKFESFLYFKLLNTLNDSLLTSDKQTNLFFIKNDWIYVNGRVCTNPSFILGVGDFLQMTVHLKYYVMYRWLLTWSIVKQNRFKQLIHARFHNKVWRADKQSTKELPAWLLDLEVRTKDVSKHLEVDYLTLSVFVLFDPIFLDNTYLNKLTEKNSLISNMYNWKYIT